MATNAPRPPVPPMEMRHIAGTLSRTFGYNYFNLIGQSRKTLKTRRRKLDGQEQTFFAPGRRARRGRQRLSAEPATVPGSPGSAGDGCDPFKKQSARDPGSADWRGAIVAPPDRGVAAHLRSRVAENDSRRLIPHALSPRGFSFSAFLLYRCGRRKNSISRNTPGKLPKEVVPSSYAIRIAPNLEKLTFTGSETVQLEVEKPVKKLVLNALEIEIAAASIDGQPLPKKSIMLDPAEQTLTLNLPNETSAGAHELALKFSGKINPQGQGLFYARYQEEGSATKKVLLGTQFEPTDARRMFPCWDEPSFRANFQLTAVVPEDFMAVSNMPIEEENKNGRRQGSALRMTPAMSSYLVVFCAGEFDSDRRRTGRREASHRHHQRQSRAGPLRAREHRNRFSITTMNTSACRTRCRSST